MEGEWVQAYPLSSQKLTLMKYLSGKEEGKRKERIVSHMVKLREKSILVFA